MTTSWLGSQGIRLQGLGSQGIRSQELRSKASKSEWTRAAIQRELGLELPKNFIPEEFLLDEATENMLSPGYHAIETPEIYYRTNERFPFTTQMNPQKHHRRPVQRYDLLERQHHHQETAMDKEVGQSKNWLCEWVLPLLFTLLTLACLFLLATEAFSPQTLNAAGAPDLSPLSTKTAPIIISAFSG